MGERLKIEATVTAEWNTGPRAAQCLFLEAGTGYHVPLGYVFPRADGKHAWMLVGSTGMTIAPTLADAKAAVERAVGVRRDGDA